VGKPIANRDLWEELEELVLYHDVNWCHVRGHSGVSDQDRCDGLAIAAARRVKCDGGHCDAL
jgi:ribonuclease HI